MDAFPWLRGRFFSFSPIIRVPLPPVPDSLPLVGSVILIRGQLCLLPASLPLPLAGSPATIVLVFDPGVGPHRAPTARTNESPYHMHSSREQHMPDQKKLRQRKKKITGKNMWEEKADH
jgi:hypothetical protein